MSGRERVRGVPLGKKPPKHRPDSAGFIVMEQGRNLDDCAPNNETGILSQKYCERIFSGAHQCSTRGPFSGITSALHNFRVVCSRPAIG